MNNDVSFVFQLDSNVSMEGLELGDLEELRSVQLDPLPAVPVVPKGLLAA